MFKYIIPLLLLTSTMLIAQPEPERVDGVATFTDEAIRHKNMELICPVNFDSSGQWNEMVEYVTIGKL